MDSAPQFCNAGMATGFGTMAASVGLYYMQYVGAPQFLIQLGGLSIGGFLATGMFATTYLGYRWYRTRHQFRPIQGEDLH